MGWTIDPANPEGKGFIAVMIFLLVVDLCFLSARLAARSRLPTRCNLSDYVLIFAFLLTIGLVVCMYDTFAHGYGMDESRFTMGDINESWKLFAPTQILWNAATTSVRISMMLFYRQLFHPVKSFGRLSLVLIAINVLNFVAIFIVALAICQPMSYVFIRTGEGHCGNAKAYDSYTAASAIVLDGSVVVLPMPLLWKLQMKTSKKWGLSVILGLGVVICTLTVVRLIASYVYMPSNLPVQDALVDFISGLEPTLGILIACLPFLPQVMTLIRRRYASASYNKSSDTDASSRPFNRLRDTELLQATHRAEAVRSESLTQDLESNGDHNEEVNSQVELKAAAASPPRGILVRQKFAVREYEAQNQC